MLFHCFMTHLELIANRSIVFNVVCYLFLFIVSICIIVKAVGTAAASVSKHDDCGLDSHSKYELYSFIRPSKACGAWETECLNINFPLFIF